MSRPVNIMSIAFVPDDAQKMLSVLGASIRVGKDLVILPETCAGNLAEGAPIDSETVKTVQKTAKDYKTNIVFPLYVSHPGAKRVNTALVINRDGEIVASYRKLYPYWSEFDIDPPCAVTDGGDFTADLDFGRIGLAICFDANFPEVWQRLSELGAELVVWSSAYSAGMQLAAYSLIHHYPIVTCTQVPDAAVYDLDGREIAYKKGEDVCVMEHTLDLDRCIFHYNFNQDKAQKLVSEHGADVEIEKDYWREQWFILRSKNMGAGARELAARYGMTELAAYQKDSKEKIDAMRIKLEQSDTPRN